MTQDLRYSRRAKLLWPGLDADKLRRTQGDPWRIARLVSRRTSLTVEAIHTLLVAADGAPAETPTRHDQARDGFVALTGDGR